MKILHTSDWHIGKKLEGIDRLIEQQKTLEEIASICDNRGIELVIVAGDIFDTAIPSAEAEELFFNSIVKLSGTNRIVVVLSGNHDDADRLCASAEIMKRHNVILVGGFDNSGFESMSNVVSTSQGGIKLKINNEIVNLALLPYPLESRMSQLLGEKLIDCSYNDKVENWLDICCKCFENNENNVLVSHLFMSGSDREDERDLGTAKELPKSIIPTQANYVALGHIHKPQYVSRSRNIVYSGSILQYSFDDMSEKSVVIVDMIVGLIKSCEKVALTCEHKLIEIVATTYVQALAKLEENQDDYVSIKYVSNFPLKASEVSEIKHMKNFVKITYITEDNFTKNIISRKSKSDAELFTEFYCSKNKKEPTKEMVSLFLDIMEELK